MILLEKYPLVSSVLGAAGLGQTFLDYSMPILQWFIAVGSLVIIVLTIILQIRKLKK
jgi:amino acid transporter